MNLIHYTIVKTAFLFNTINSFKKFIRFFISNDQVCYPLRLLCPRF